MTKRTGPNGWVLLLGILLVLFAAQYVATKPTVTPAASQAVNRFVTQQRREAALAGQETNQGYVIDPSLAQRMLADTTVRARVTGVRGFGPTVIARAVITAPLADSAHQKTTQYFSLTESSPGEWTVAAATARAWHLKLW